MLYEVITMIKTGPLKNSDRFKDPLPHADRSGHGPHIFEKAAIVGSV